METVLAAAVGAVPPTIAALAAWRSSAAGRRAAENVDRAVNHQPPGAPTLVEKVDQLTTRLEQVDQKVDRVDDRLRRLETRVG